MSISHDAAWIRHGSHVPEAWMTLVIGTLVTGAAMLSFHDDIGAKVLAMTLLWLTSVASVRFDVSHPFVWFGGSFLLYSISGPLLFDMGVHPIPVWGGVPIEELDFSFAMDLQYLGLLACTLAIGPDRVNLAAALRDSRRNQYFVGIVPVLAAAVLIAGVGVSEVIAQGFTRKIDVILYGTWTTRLDFGMNIATTCIGVLLVKQLTERNRTAGYATIACGLAVGVLIILVTGQRSILFRILIVAFFAFHIANRNFSFKTFAVMALVLSPSIFLLGGLKMAALSKPIWDLHAAILDDVDFEQLSGYARIFDDPNALLESPAVLYAKLGAVMVMGNEFMTAGNNLAMLVWRVPHEIPYQNGWTLLNDVVEGLKPGFLMLGEPSNTTNIYNRMFFPVSAAEGHGQGFSLVGTGYFNFGVTGVIAIMAIFGLAIRAIYHCASKSALGLFFFLGFLPVAIWATRGDLAGPISQSLKHVLLPLLAMRFLSYAASRRKPAW